MKSLALAFSLLLIPVAAQTQSLAQSLAQSPDCSLSPSGWELNTPVTAAADPATLGQAELTLGKASHVTLHPASKVRYAVAPERAPDLTLHGGLVAVTIPAAGNYRVGLSSGAWLDVLKDGKPVASAAHGHGEGCVRKAVTFFLEPGLVVIQLSGNREADLRMMVWRQD
jgi:hypothetical protein